MSVEFYFTTNHRHDVDNRLKPLLDALEAADCFVNDYQLDQLHVQRHRKGHHEMEEACTVVSISKIWTPDWDSCPFDEENA